MEATSTQAPALDLSAGIYVKGLPVSDTAFVAVTKFGQIQATMRDPRTFANQKAWTFDPDLEDEAAIHDLVQRALTGSKKANVPKYAQYIEDVVMGRISGVLPPIHGVAFEKLEVVHSGGTQYAVIPVGRRLMALDGETQLTAHFTLASGAEPELKRAHSEFPLTMVIHHGISVEAARQFFHDLNVLAVRPNTSLSLAMDERDPLSQLVGELEAAIPFLTGRVDRQARQLSKKSSKVLTFGALRQAVINLVYGMSGIQYGSRPVPVEDVDLGQVKAVATDWLKAYFDEFAAEVVDREKTLAGSAPVLAAVGAMGSQILKATPADRGRLRDMLIADLKRVDWSKGQPWAGVAGKFTARGTFAVGGTKEVAYAIYNVLTDPDNPGYMRIRSVTAPSGQDAIRILTAELPRTAAVTRESSGSLE